MIKVEVVDNSARMGRIMTEIINSNPGSKFIDTAINDKFALKKSKPDI